MYVGTGKRHQLNPTLPSLLNLPSLPNLPPLPPQESLQDRTLAEVNQALGPGGQRIEALGSEAFHCAKVVGTTGADGGEVLHAYSLCLLHAPCIWFCGYSARINKDWWIAEKMEFYDKPRALVSAVSIMVLMVLRVSMVSYCRSLNPLVPLYVQ